ncbi:hypothetical protein STEG23_036327 [Scotinomys teguina]
MRETGQHWEIVVRLSENQATAFLEEELLVENVLVLDMMGDFQLYLKHLPSYSVRFRNLLHLRPQQRIAAFIVLKMKGILISLKCPFMQKGRMGGAIGKTPISKHEDLSSVPRINIEKPVPLLAVWLTEIC